MELKEHTFMSSITASGASAKYLTDFRYNDVPQRTIQGVLTSGAAVALYTHVSRTSEDTRQLVSTYTASSFNVVIDGPVAAIEIVKTCACGTAWVDGLV